MMVLLVIEGLAMCFLLLLVCVIGIANGPVGCVYFYEKEVQDKVVELGLTTKERIKRDSAIAKIVLIVPLLLIIPVIVYFVNGARGFWNIFYQMTTIMMIEGLFDRVFIDWYWVGKTKAWFIPGTEDLMPYVPKKVLVKKWLPTIVGYPILAVLLSWFISLF